MHRHLVLEQKSVTRFNKVLMLVFGLPFTAFGLIATTKVIAALFANPLPDHFLLGALVSLAFLGLGGVMIFLFTLPDKRITFDPARGTALVRFTYPMGLTREACFDIARLPAPDVVFDKDSDLRDGGYWRLKVNLPTGRAIVWTPPPGALAEEKAQTEALRDAILALRG